MSEKSTQGQPNPSIGYQQHDDEIDLRHLIAILLDGRFIIGGVIKGAIRRIPKEGSIVSNIGQGGKAVSTTLTSKEICIAKVIAKSLKKNKIVVIIQMMNMDSTFPVNEFSINLGSTANSDTPNRLYLLWENFLINR